MFEQALGMDKQAHASRFSLLVDMAQIAELLHWLYKVGNCHHHRPSLTTSYFSFAEESPRCVSLEPFRDMPTLLRNSFVPLMGLLL